ncbi:3-oxoacyl-ACP synthase III family protein [Streptomyces sp. NPDC003006]
MAGIDAYLPRTILSTAELEDEIAEHSPHFDVPRGLIQRLTGVERRHVRPEGWRASDLAVAACERMLGDLGRSVRDIDLLVFAAASTDVVEPATAHIVAAKLGAVCPVMDVKNACNSFLNGVQVADAFIRCGAYRTVLVCTGEELTRLNRRSIAGPREFVEAIAGNTMSDAGAAMLLEASPEPGILAAEFLSNSAAWASVVLPLDEAGGGRPRLAANTAKLVEAFDVFGASVVSELHDRVGHHPRDAPLCCVHLAATSLIPLFCGRSGVPENRLVTTIAEHGNTASATLPLQLAAAMRSGRVGAGDVVPLIGTASGVSLGIVLVRL